MAPLVPERQRRFALEVVGKLRAAGYEAYWAGGCVRDRLLGREPKDYDVATDATPAKIRQLFGRRRTIAVGAAFGVITVLGPPGAGQIEVATFRRDATYRDGRHPESVTFTSAREDALRRDFTINGLFFDPIAGQVIDYVGGREDLDARLIRAIGDPHQRFAEDKLRLLRAVRFAAEFGFEIEPGTLAAIRHLAPEIRVVSPERIAAEMQRLLVGPSRVQGVRLLVDTHLADVLLPELNLATSPEPGALEPTLAVLAQLREPSFPLALAVLLHLRVSGAGAEAICRRWRLANHQTARVVWLVQQHTALEQARSLCWSALQPILVAEGIGDLLALTEARALAGMSDLQEVEFCRQMLARSPAELDPVPLLTGDDLIAHGIAPGPRYKTLLQRVRDAQLDGQVHSKAEALALVDRLVAMEGKDRTSSD